MSTLQEAEYFANSGFKDILYAVCIIPKKLARLDFLQKKYDCVIRIVIDSNLVAKAIVDYSNSHSTKFETLIEIDCGEGRSGLYVEDKKILEISKIFSECSKKNLVGVLTHAGHSYSTDNKVEISSIANKERDDALAAVKYFSTLNHNNPILSIGSTPTMLFASHLNNISEVRAGIYMFWDLAQASRGICKIEDIAVTVLASVIGHNHQKKKIIIDAGALALSKDISANRFMPEVGYGLVCDPNSGEHLGLNISEIHQEHGAINISNSDWFDNLPIGSLVRVLPNHSCLTCAGHSSYNILENNMIIESTILLVTDFFILAIFFIFTLNYILI